MRIACSLFVVTAVFWGLASDSASAIEAVRGKTYTLSKQHGPWMIMVASFRNVPEDRREKGLSAEEAAGELVFELREKGIPAYVYAQGAVIEHISTLDRQERHDDRIYAAQRDMISVIAGNYPSVDDGTAQKTLKYLKAYHPKFMKDEKSGAIYRQKPGGKGPLSGAFMTVNPLIKSEELAMSDPIIRNMNLSSNSLLTNKRKFTLVVATFVGKQAMPIGPSKYAGDENKFIREIESSTKDKSAYNLNRAGEDAEQLTKALREKGYEAYVYHDRYQSLVTVGGFDTETDPKARALVPHFCAKQKEDPVTKQNVVVGESLVHTIPPNRNNPNGSTQTWVFDPQPQLMPVPRLK
ncbi:MAG: hypothetical protein Q8K78_16880 [Planctomycetaceae bacterium]|nr:hypothetical protein [Planctomycetaceae bacterium]